MFSHEINSPVNTSQVQSALKTNSSELFLEKKKDSVWIDVHKFSQKDLFFYLDGVLFVCLSV